MRSGIYCIANGANSKLYIGSSKDLPARWYAHRYALRRGKHTNTHMQHAWNVYGDSAFVFSILEYCESEDLKDRETWWMCLLDTRSPHKGYNLWSADRHEVSDETRAKISAAQKLIGNRPPKVDWTGRTHTPKAKAKMAVAKQGKATWNKGLSPSAITRQKLSAAGMGKPSPSKGSYRSSDSRLKMSLASQGKNAKTYQFLSPSGQEVTITNLYKFCRENALCSSNMSKVARGLKTCYKGWRTHRIES